MDWTSATVGKSIPEAQNLLTIRWWGTANFELTYGNQVILLGAYFDRGPRNRPTGIKVDQISKVDAVFLGHAHFDHMSDATQVARQTGASVYGHRIVVDTLLTQGLPSSQTKLVNNGDIFQFDDFVVEAFHVLHSNTPGTPPELPEDAQAAFKNLVSVAHGTPTIEEEAAEAAILSRGSWDPDILSNGVFAYLFTFGDDFRFIYHDSACCVVTEEAKAIMERIGGKADIATIAYQGGPQQFAVPYGMPELRLFHPSFFIPNHHDEIKGAYFDMATEPLFEAIRHEWNHIAPISLLYGEPVYFDVHSHAMVAKGSYSLKKQRKKHENRKTH
ncbi:MAG TPA: MBL fold metallo-hydrolase [Syntrophorhabdaceae bacterium]|nr:MBL fold metallo-hydrolase [Syntrophorhabdaceae bacterium]